MLPTVPQPLPNRYTTYQYTKRKFYSIDPHPLFSTVIVMTVLAKNIRYQNLNVAPNFVLAISQSKVVPAKMIKYEWEKEVERRTIPPKLLNLIDTPKK